MICSLIVKCSFTEFQKHIVNISQDCIFFSSGLKDQITFCLMTAVISVLQDVTSHQHSLSTVMCDSHMVGVS